jgi:hypothetical protein
MTRPVITLANKDDALHFVAGKTLYLGIDSNGVAYRLTWWQRLLRVIRNGFRRRRFVVTAVTAVDVEAGTITLDRVP